VLAGLAATETVEVGVGMGGGKRNTIGLRRCFGFGRNDCSCDEEDAEAAIDGEADDAAVHAAAAVGGDPDAKCMSNGVGLNVGMSCGEGDGRSDSNGGFERDA